MKNQHRSMTWIALLLVSICMSASVAKAGLPQVIRDAQSKMVKIYGSGGFKGLESYQSGFLISGEGHILTTYSYVLDSDYVTATLDDGHKYEAKLLGADPKLEVAVLKIELRGTDVPHYDLAKAAIPAPGTQVLAFSNLYGVAVGDEPVSVQRGVVSAVTNLEARRGGYDTLYNGKVYVVDAMTNNPGASGGALTNWRGELLGMLGKELRNSRNNIWLNYAMPISELNDSIERIKAGKAPPVGHEKISVKLEKPMTLSALGIVLVPNVLERTPPFVDSVRENSPAAKAGIRTDDLVVFIDEQLVQSCDALTRMLDRTELDASIKIIVRREEQQQQQFLEFTIQIPSGEGR